MNGTLYIGAVQTFIKICNCDCGVACACCDENCKSYGIIIRYHTEQAFCCNFSNSFLPHIYKCTLNPEITVAVEINNILQLLFQINVDTNIYVIVPPNTVEKE